MSKTRRVRPEEKRLKQPPKDHDKNYWVDDFEDDLETDRLNELDEPRYRDIDDSIAIRY